VKVLIVDDDRTLADLLAFTMRRAGFETQIAYDTPGALRVFKQEPIDLIILDVNLPGEAGLKNGFEVLAKIRQTSDVPIILLTVRADEEDIVHGLSMGADDYVVKPFSPRQLVARVETLLRRSTSGRLPGNAPFVDKDITFDPARREFIRQGQTPVTLSRLEARLLEYLMLNLGQVLPAEAIIDHVWGPGGGSAEMLRQLVRRLRLQIEWDPTHPEIIQTFPGIGYGFSAQ